MRRSGFTMIELIFVIVILGILAAVALPKFIGVTEQAKEGNLKAFVGTLNRTVGPTLWSKSMARGQKGNISGITDDLTRYTEIPEGNTSAPDFSKCTTTAGSSSDAFMEYKIGDTEYKIVCREGNETDAPRFGLYIKNGNSWEASIDIPSS
ncbi:MAG: type II secretion system protein [Epsilonproteobacteria bacterium]|nr:type II secretion system protein [Campylobacterota bacterium]NPA63589.1 type II secretion system protein [Campylobacterota bacterium]